MRDEEAERKERAIFFEKCVTCVINRRLSHCTEHIDKTFSEDERRQRLLEIDGVFRANSEYAFTLSKELCQEKPFRFITKVGDDTVENNEFIFVETTTSCQERKIKRDIEKYEKIFDRHNFAFDADLIGSKNIHLVIVFDKSLRNQDDIMKTVKKARLLFKSITVFFCHFVDLFNTWCALENPITITPPDIFSFLDQHFSEIKNSSDLMQQCNEMNASNNKMLTLNMELQQSKVNTLEQNFINRVMKNGQGNWAFKTNDYTYSNKVRYSF